MKVPVLALVVVLTAAPAYAQLGGLGRTIRKANDAKDKVTKLSDLVISDADERKIGEKVSDIVRVEFGVFQDKAVTRYVTLVGMALAKASTRPDLNWEFIVLDTDGVNAFASPGGLVHITRGALGLIKSEAELAGVLGHEIAHVTRKHTVNAIKKNKTFELGADMAPGSNALFDGLANLAYDNIVEKGFDRGDEEDADAVGLRLANTLTYDPSGLGTFLTKLAARNKDATNERNALFASHPETQGRIDKLNRRIKSEKLTGTALVQARYASAITFDATPLTEITAVVAGTRGVAGGSGKADEKAKDEKAEEKPKRGFGLGPLSLSKGPQQESTQASASAGNRAVGKDRAAKGGSNPSKLSLPPLTPAELEAFTKGIAG
jgi:predicted Zn-dependent protease